jgi:hypothetical protein
MSKMKRHLEDRENEGLYHEDYLNHKKEKRIKNALRSNNLDDLMDEYYDEDFYEYTSKYLD